MRRLLPIAALVAALSLILAACGGSSSSKKDNSSGSDPASIKPTLTWWDTSDPTNEAPAFKELIAKFNKTYPNITINYQSVPFADAQAKFKTAASSKSGAPDILRAEVAWVPEFASLGYLYALDGTSVLKDNEFLPTPLSSDQFDGKTYGVPQVTDTLGLMYNKKLFEKAGITAAPTTWQEVADAAAKLKKVGVDGLYINSGGYFMLPFIYGDGGDMVNPETKTIEINSAASVKGVEVAQQLVKSGAAVKPDANDSYGTMMTLFKSGKVAMIINGPWEVANISKDPAFGGFENLGIAPIPAGSAGAGAPVGGHNYVIYSGMDQSKAKAALAFVGFMASAESEAFIADKLGLLPGNKGAYALITGNEKVNAWTGALEDAKPRPWIPAGGQFFAALDEMAVKVLVNGEDPKKALDAVANTYKNEVVKDYTLNE